MIEKLAPANRAQSGPFDSSEVDLPANYLDFGSIRFVSNPEVSIRLEVEEATNKVVALTFETLNSILQVTAFSAAKDEGVWQEVCNQLAGSIITAGGDAKTFQGQLGLGLDAMVLQPDKSLRSIRFIGVDGPRWFLRGSITGAATSDLMISGQIEDLFRSLVVHRGTAPMPPKEALELILPPGIISSRPGL